MSKKLFYGNTEVTPYDPRLPEILANIIEMIQNAGCEYINKLSFDHQTHASFTTREKVYVPGRCLKIGKRDVDDNRIDTNVSTTLASAFNYQGTLYPNHEGFTVADCLNQPGFKVVDDEED
jgi:DNA modification methylase